MTDGGPEDPGPETDDELFRQIVEGFGEEPADPVPRWPVSEDLDLTDPEPSGPPMRRRRDDPPEAELPEWLEPAALEDDSHFEPPPPPRVPRLRPRTIAACTALLLGLLVLFAPTLVGLDDSVVWLLLGLVLTGGGAGLLVAWMRDAPSAGDGPDDGAVV